MNDLDRDTDELNRLLLAAEEKLDSMKLSVQANVTLGIQPADGEEIAEATLTFGRHGKEWGLHIKGVPITSCSRAQKVAAVHQLEAMKQKLLEAHEQWKGNVREAIDVAKKFVDDNSPNKVK